MLVQLAFCVLLAAAAAADLRAFRIPNWVSAALVALFLVNGLPQHAELGWVGHLGAGGAVLAAGLVVYALGGMGAGDVKLLAATSLWLGPSLLMPHLLATSLLGLGLMRRLPPAGAGSRPPCFRAGASPTASRSPRRPRSSRCACHRPSGSSDEEGGRGGRRSSPRRQEYGLTRLGRRRSVTRRSRKGGRQHWT